MVRNRAARRCGNTERASVHVVRDTQIVPDFERYSHIAAWIIGLAFGVMFALAILAG